MRDFDILSNSFRRTEKNWICITQEHFIHFEPYYFTSLEWIFITQGFTLLQDFVGNNISFQFNLFPALVWKFIPLLISSILYLWWSKRKHHILLSLLEYGGGWWLFFGVFWPTPLNNKNIVQSRPFLEFFYLTVLNINKKCCLSIRFN